MNRRTLLVSSAALAASLVPGVASAYVLHTHLIPLPFVKSNIRYTEWSMDGMHMKAAAVKKDLGRVYSVCPRATQIMKEVDKELAHLKGLVGTLKLSLVDASGATIGDSCEVEAFRGMGKAIGWFGAGKVLRAAGLTYGDRRLDDIKYVSVTYVR